MTLQERIKRVIDNVDEVVQLSKDLAVNEIYGYSKDRIFNKGLDKNNKQIGEYSDRKLPAFFFNNKGNNKKGKINPKDYPNGLSYKEFRALNNLRTDRVNLTFSTDLQDSITRRKDVIYFGNEYGKKVSAYNEKTFNKKIFAPSKEEKNIFLTIFDEEMDKLWNSK